MSAKSINVNVSKLKTSVMVKILHFTDTTKQNAINLETFLKSSSSSEVHILVIQYFANKTEKSLCIQTPRSYN